MYCPFTDVTQKRTLPKKEKKKDGEDQGSDDGSEVTDGSDEDQEMEKKAAKSSFARRGRGKAKDGKKTKKKGGKKTSAKKDCMVMPPKRTVANGGLVPTKPTGCAAYMPTCSPLREPAWPTCSPLRPGEVDYRCIDYLPKDARPADWDPTDTPNMTGRSYTVRLGFHGLSRVEIHLPWEKGLGAYFIKTDMRGTEVPSKKEGYQGSYRTVSWAKYGGPQKAWNTVLERVDYGSPVSVWSTSKCLDDAHWHVQHQRNRLGMANRVCD